MAERVIRWSTLFAVLGVSAVAAVASYKHAYGLVRAHGESGWTAHMVRSRWAEAGPLCAKRFMVRAAGFRMLAGKCVAERDGREQTLDPFGRNWPAGFGTERVTLIARPAGRSRVGCAMRHRV